jgi:ribonucleoside-triphosphate reductase
MTMEQINARLEELKQQKAALRGTETEVYARIVGYYRSVRNWNAGKKEEYRSRLNYSSWSGEKKPPAAGESSLMTLVKTGDPSPVSPALSDGRSTGYLYFFRKTCPNCPPVAAWLKHCGLEGRAVDVDRESGFHEAAKYDISTAPTVVFLDGQGRETGRGSSISALEAQVGAASAAGA